MDKKFETPITEDILYQLDLDTIQDVYQMMVRRVESSLEACLAVQGKCMTLLGWMLAALASLVGVAVIQLDTSFSLDWLVLGPTIWGIVSLSFIGVRLLLKTLQRIETYSSGDDPSTVLREDVLKHCDTFSLPDKHKHILGYEVNQLQIHFDHNVAVNKRIVSAYRSTIWLTLGAFVVAILVTAFCYLAL